jgi:hypothetical protein
VQHFELGGGRPAAQGQGCYRSNPARRETCAAKEARRLPGTFFPEHCDIPHVAFMIALFRDRNNGRIAFGICDVPIARRIR